MAQDNAEMEVQRLKLVQHFSTLAAVLRDCADAANGFSASIATQSGSNLTTQQMQQLLMSSNQLIRPAAAAYPMFPLAWQQQQQQPMDVDSKPKEKRKRAPAEKKEKDPLAPKRPASAYLLYQNEVRAATKEKYPNLSYHEMLNKISAQWTAMTVEEKAPYVEATRKAKEKWEHDKTEYSTHKEENGASSPAAATPAAAAPAKPKVVIPIPQPAIATQASSEEEESEESSEEEEDSSEESSEEKDEDQLAPPPKKTKQNPVTPTSAPPKKTSTSHASQAAIPQTSTPREKSKESKGKEGKKEKKSKT